jgi:ParB-like chromosome segregation protein Spo0J
VDGHLRLKAARKLGIGQVPVILFDEWTEAQVKAFRLMVNRLVTWAEWVEELLGLELLHLKSLDFDLDLIGFDANESGRLSARYKKYRADRQRRYGQDGSEGRPVMFSQLRGANEP